MTPRRAANTPGALLLASSGLSALRRVVDPGAAPLLAGRVLAQWARVERYLGDLDVAGDLYDRTAVLGRRHGLPELLVRAEMGRAVLARIRGNYPETRTRFRRALARAERAGLGELTGLAHQGLLIAAAVAGDFDTALTHGWAAFARVAGDGGKEAEVLVNLAGLCLDARQDAAALRGYSSAAERTRDMRTWLSATAGLAVAAARVGRDELLRESAAAVEHALASKGAPYERAQHLLTLSDAFTDADDPERAAGYRERGLDIARANGFSELELRYTTAPDKATAVRQRPAPPPLGAGARRVVREIGALPGRAGPATLSVGPLRGPGRVS